MAFPTKAAAFLCPLRNFWRITVNHSTAKYMRVLQRKEACSDFVCAFASSSRFASQEVSAGTKKLDTERTKGPSEKRDFQAETTKLLDIVAKSLYSEKEIFLRELISNASDALEKFRYVIACNESKSGFEPEMRIDIVIDAVKKTISIQDTGVGMTKKEITENLGVIATSGSKAFLEEIEAEGVTTVDKNIIGKFGVGFYSAFMVANRVDVYTQSHKLDESAYWWSSEGIKSYEMSEAENVQRGTKVILHLKDQFEYLAEEKIIKEVIKKYSNFVGFPIFINDKRINTVQALWMLEPKDITDEMHEEFYRFISNSFDKPRYCLHYKTDAPVNIRAILYVPDYKPTLFDMSQQSEVSIAVYSRKIMIMNQSSGILPHWLRFLRGVVDSEDILLNLSRELLQDSSLMRKLRWVLANRLIKFFIEQSKRDKEKYCTFYDDYGLFFREGIVTTAEQDQKEEISKLLQFESNNLAPGERTTLTDYVSRMKAGSRTIYYLSAPCRQLAETSPYMETMQSRDVEVLYCYESFDELVLMNLAQFDKKTLKSVETELAMSSENQQETASVENCLSPAESDELLQWLQMMLGHRVKTTKITKRLVKHPCVVTVPEMGAARHLLRTSLADKTEKEKFEVLQPTLEINPAHPIIMQLHKLKDSDSELAKLVTEQMYDNAMLGANLLDDPRKMLLRMNDLLTRVLSVK